MHNLGAFFGEIAKAIKTNPTKAPAARTAQLAATHTSQQVQTQLGPATATTRTVDELQVTAPQPNQPQQITARRTTVEEVTLELPPQPESHR
jgi:hypothetical protein